MVNSDKAAQIKVHGRKKRLTVIPVSIGIRDTFNCDSPHYVRFPGDEREIDKYHGRIIHSLAVLIITICIFNWLDPILPKAGLLTLNDLYIHKYKK